MKFSLFGSKVTMCTSALFCVQRLSICILILSWLGRTDALYKLTNAMILNEDESFMRVEYCRLKAVRRNVAELSFKVNLYKPVVDLMINVEYLRKYNGYKPFLFNVTFDGCWFLRTLKTHKDMGIVTMIWNTFSKYTNLNQTCPITVRSVWTDNNEKGDVWGEKFYPKDDDFKNLPWPTGEYMLKGNFWVQKKLRARMHVYFTYKENEKLGTRKF